MATQVQFWRTTDGQLFESENEAEPYENRQAAITFLAGKATAFVSTDAQDFVLLALGYLSQPGSPVTITYTPAGA